MLYPNGTRVRPHVSSPYGPRDPNIGISSFHAGADLVGFRRIYAVAAGRVTFAGWLNDAAGNTIIIDHGKGVTSVYMHNAEHDVRTRDRVREGQQIAVMGETGNASGPCNHLEIRVRGKSTEPLGYIAARLTRNPAPAGTTTEEYPDMFIAIIRKKDWYLVTGGKACLLGAASGARDSGAPILNFVDDWAVNQLKSVVTGIK